MALLPAHALGRGPIPRAGRDLLPGLAHARLRLPEIGKRTPNSDDVVLFAGTAGPVPAHGDIGTVGSGDMTVIDMASLAMLKKHWPGAAP